jgi:hypothetical protein
MSIRHRVVAALLRLYPSAWRNEYGAELSDILLTGPFGARVIGDVIRSGLWQRVRTAQPSTFLGLASLLVMLTGLVLPGGRYGHEWTALLRLTSMTFPTVEVTFLSTEVYLWLLMVCGCWTSLRYGSTATEAGVAGMRMSLIASIPIILGGLLIAFGMLDVMFFFDPGSAASALSEPGSHTRPSARSFPGPGSWRFSLPRSLACQSTGYLERSAASWDEASRACGRPRPRPSCISYHSSQ